MTVQTPPSPHRIIVVGASLAGFRVVQALRRLGFTGVLTLVGAEQHLPYDRPPLTKRYLAGHLEDDELALAEADALDALDVRLELGVAAAGLDRRQGRVMMADGRALLFDRLVIATGAHPVVPAVFAHRGVTGFRTRTDAATLRDRLAAGDRVAVVGGGFIGAEIASTASDAGRSVTLIEALGNPMERVLGPEIAEILAAMHVERGVELVTGSPVVDVLGDRRVEGLRLADGRRVEADHVVVSVGVRPATQWLSGCGFDLADGVACDARGRALVDGAASASIHAVGDVAAWYYPRYGRLRVEHWTTAVEMAPIAARDILGLAGPGDAPLGLPYFWSDQCGRKIQLIGRRGTGDRVDVVAGTADSGKFLAVYHDGDKVTAALAFGMPRELMQLRPSLDDGTPWPRLRNTILAARTS